MGKYSMKEPVLIHDHSAPVPSFEAQLEHETNYRVTVIGIVAISYDPNSCFIIDCVVNHGGWA
jgi:hypothetical protein